MREKNLVILCIIFAVLISLVFLKKSTKPQVPTTEEVSDIIGPSINNDNITGMVLRIGDGTGGDQDNPKKVQFTKQEDNWVIDTQFGVYARDNTITPVLEKLDQIEGELRSNKKNLLSDYGITDEEGVHVEFMRQDGQLLHVVVGTKKAGVQNNFVRLGGSNAVYVVNENLLGTLGVRIEDDDQKLNVNKWTDKRIARINASEVIGITIADVERQAANLIDLKRETVDGKKQWQSTPPYDFGLSATKIKSAIEIFNNTYAKDVIAADVEGVFDAPGWTGVFTLEDGSHIKLVRGAKDDDESNYYVKQEGAGYYYRVPVSTFHSRMNQQGGIFANNPLKISEGNIDSIEIREMDTKKEFSAVKKAAPPAGDDAPDSESAEGQEEKREDIWEDSNGKVADKAKVQGIINALKGINLEITPQPSMSLKDAIIIRVTKSEETTEYKVSEINKSETGKECHFLSIAGGELNYCASKSNITTLLNTLP